MVAFQFSSFIKFLLEASLEVLDIYSKDHSTSTKHARDLCLLDMIHAQQIGNRVDHSLPEALEDLQNLSLLRVAHAPNEHLYSFGVLVLIEVDLPEDIVDFML